MTGAETVARILEEIETLFNVHGHETYGEGVTMAEHSLQTAALAREGGCDEALVVAALLHDIGHFLELSDDDFGYHRHDQTGGAWLAARFPPAVSEPVRMHVAAKRYLCAVQSDYFDILSPASRHSLAKQGGPMTAEEAKEFVRHPYHDRALELRRSDDLGKMKGLQVPSFASYSSSIERLLHKFIAAGAGGESSPGSSMIGKFVR